MKTNHIPALITLSAGAIYCIIGLTKNTSGIDFVKTLLIVLIIFFVVGSIIKLILDYSFRDFGKEEESESEEEDDRSEKEDISTDD